MKTLYFNGNIITMEKNNPKVQAVLTENKKIIALGNYSDLLEKIDDQTRKFDLKSMTLLPGFIDAHSHVSKVPKSLVNVDLAPPPIGNKSSISDIIEALKKELEINKEKYNEKNWLVGQNYDNKEFANNKKLTKFELDKISLEIPIFVLHFSYHSGIANSKLLELLNINENTIDENDVSYERVSGTKEPNGILKENALNNHPEIWKMVTGFEDKEVWLDVWKPVVKYYASQGYTTVQDGNLSSGGYDYLTYIAKKKALVLDVITYIDSLDKELFDRLKNNCPIKNQLTNFQVRGIKLIIDGTLELWTAWLSKPYHTQINDNPSDYCGNPRIDLNLAYEKILWCLNNNKQIIAHCIGDQASEEFINLYQKALKATTNKEFKRPVMIHATTVRYDQLQRMKKLNMMPTYFAEDIYYFAEFFTNTVLGKTRAENISPTGWTKKLDLKFSMNHDCPVYKPNSILTLHHCVNRLTPKNKILGKEQRISIYDALASLTINAAYQYHEEENIGSIAINKKADFVILDKSPLEIESENIKNIKVIKTIKNDEVIYCLE